MPTDLVTATDEVRHAWMEEVGRVPANRKTVTFRPYNLYLDPPPGARILDVGAYLGANLLHFAAQGYECVGIEASQAYVERFEEELLKHQPGSFRYWPVMIHGMFEDWLPEGKFGAILCGETLCYSPRPGEIIRKIHACLEPAGVALIVVQEVEYSEYPSFLPGAALVELVQEAGLRVNWARSLGENGQGIYAVRAFRGGAT